MRLPWVMHKTEGYAEKEHAEALDAARAIREAEDFRRLRYKAFTGRETVETTAAMVSNALVAAQRQLELMQSPRDTA